MVYLRFATTTIIIMVGMVVSEAMDYYWIGAWWPSVSRETEMSISYYLKQVSKSLFWWEGKHAIGTKLCFLSAIPGSCDGVIVRKMIAAA